ncbi:hypothetical protein P7C73_g2188, partial [Tremellales sp. Uapishka_1]
MQSHAGRPLPSAAVIYDSRQSQHAPPGLGYRSLANWSRPSTASYDSPGSVGYSGLNHPNGQGMRTPVDFQYMPPPLPVQSIRIHPDWAAVAPPTWTASHPVIPSFHRPRNGIEVTLKTAHTSAESLAEQSTGLGLTVDDFPPLEHGVAKEKEKAASPTKKLDKAQVELDKYAKVYHPAWLLDLPPPLHVYKLPITPPFPSADYPNEILTASQTHSRLPVIPIDESILARPPFEGALIPLDPAGPVSYATHFSNLLSLVLAAQMELMQKATLYQVPLHPERQARATKDTYRLHIPGIREDSPHLEIGDVLLLRGLYPGLKAPSKVEVEAEVVGLHKAKGWVYIKAPELETIDVSLPKFMVKLESKGDLVKGKKEESCSMYQVRFRVSATQLCVMQDAVMVFDDALHNHTKERSTAQRWLFPEVQDVVPRQGEETAHLPIDWVDAALNEEQKAAVLAVASNGDARIPNLISGPPGTLVEAVHQILRQNPHASVLVCAPSNPAADTLARRLSAQLGVTEMLRLNAPTRTFAEVPQELMIYCNVKDDRFDIPPFQELLRYKVVVCACVDASILVHARATNSEMMRAELELWDRLHPRGGRTSQQREIAPHWTHLVIDEAGQGSEPELLIPMSIVLPYPLGDNIRTEDPLLVLCGDIHQCTLLLLPALSIYSYKITVGPIIPSEAARDGELDISLLERLFMRGVYADHPSARGSRSARWVNGERYRPPFTNLVKSWFNEGEIQCIADLIKSLLSERPDVLPEQIAVITPWREQVWRMRARLRSVGLGSVDVGNVETYQGGEFRVTILSCVRSRARFLDDDRKINMGLYNERKRFNVAITRAKELLVVVGNANLLKGDPSWNGFLQVMLRNKCYKGPLLEMECTTDYVSRLEQVSLIHRSVAGADPCNFCRSRARATDEMTEDEAAMLLVGAIARETLKE